MSTATPSSPDLLTAEEYARRPELGYAEELVRGRTVPMPYSDRRHGQICNKVGRILGNFAEHYDLGHVLNNEAGVITRRDPDTVRAPDVAFYSYKRLPKGPLPASYGPEMPELVVELRLPGDRWAKYSPRSLSTSMRESWQSWCSTTSRERHSFNSRTGRRACSAQTTTWRFRRSCPASLSRRGCFLNDRLRCGLARRTRSECFRTVFASSREVCPGRRARTPSGRSGL